MRCDEFLQAIDAYLDDELSVMDILRAHGHLLSCEFCHRVIGSEATLHSLLAQDASREQPPGSLRERIICRLADEEKVTLPGKLPEPRSRPGPVASLSAVLVAGLLVGLLVLVTWLPGDRGPGDLVPLAAEVAAKHLLYGSGQGPALEFRTSEPSEMTRWVERRIGLSLKLPELDRADDRLVGARISSLADAPAAYLLYERGGRHISLFVTRPLPGASRGGAEKVVDGVELHTAALRSVTLAWWEEEDEGRLYAAASAGDPGELRQFALLWIRSGEAAKPV
jgi:mycothiol system anti-sigma-R factor